MNRRDFIKGVAVAGVTLAAGEFFVPFAEAIDIPRFTFAHITDLHLDVKGASNWQHREKSVSLFNDALKQLQKLPRAKSSFVVFGGDQVHYGANDKESFDVFQKGVAALDVPYYILLGNTEVSPLRGVSKMGREDYLKGWSGKGLKPGSSSWAFDPVRDVRAIGFDVTMDGKPQGDADPARLKWLEDELKANTDKKLIMIFTHQLLMPTSPRDTSPDWSLWMVRNHEKVRSVLAQYPNVRLVVSGHHHVSKVETVGRTTYVSDPAIVTYPCAFRAFTVSREGIHLKNIEVGDKVTTDRAKDLLATDPYAKMYDREAPQKVAEYSRGLTDADRETMIKL